MQQTAPHAEHEVAECSSHVIKKRVRVLFQLDTERIRYRALFWRFEIDRRYVLNSLHLEVHPPLVEDIKYTLQI